MRSGRRWSATGPCESGRGSASHCPSHAVVAPPSPAQQAAAPEAAAAQTLVVRRWRGRGMRGVWGRGRRAPRRCTRPTPSVRRSAHARAAAGRRAAAALGPSAGARGWQRGCPARRRWMLSTTRSSPSMAALTASASTHVVEPFASVGAAAAGRAPAGPHSSTPSCCGSRAPRRSAARSRSCRSPCRR